MHFIKTFGFPWRIEIKHVSSHSNNSIDEEIRVLDRNSADCSRNNSVANQLPVAPHHQRNVANRTIIDYNRYCVLHTRHQAFQQLLTTSELLLPARLSAAFPSAKDVPTVCLCHATGYRAPDNGRISSSWRR